MYDITIVDEPFNHQATHHSLVLNVLNYVSKFNNKYLN